MDFHPFKNEADIVQVAGLTIENRLDRVSLYGSIDITLDKEGMEAARQLKELLDLTLAELEVRGDLPEHVAMVEPESVDNPFL